MPFYTCASDCDLSTRSSRRDEVGIMKRNWFVRLLKFALFAVVFLAVFTFMVMSLWNWLMPAVFGWHPINFWQALGLLILSKILFSGFRGAPHHQGHWRGWM